jgi:hypothetical protein
MFHLNVGALAQLTYVAVASSNAAISPAGKGPGVQVVSPGAAATEFRDLAGLALLTTDDMVDVALAGLDQGEVVTLQSLADKADRTDMRQRAVWCTGGFRELPRLPNDESRTDKRSLRLPQ